MCVDWRDLRTQSVPVLVGDTEWTPEALNHYSLRSNSGNFAKFTSIRRVSSNPYV
jgi:hypothetical protein